MTATGIIIDCERMKFPHTGLYHYCRQLGMALMETDNHRQHLSFYVPLKELNIFGEAVDYKIQHSRHKISMPFANKYALWHCTYQGSNYFPRASAAKIVLTVHDLNFLHEKKSPQKIKKYLRSLQKKIDRSDAVVAISAYVKKELENYIDAKGMTIQVIHNGCNISDDIQAIDPRLQMDKPFFFTIGTIAPKKNFHVLPAMLLQNDYHLVIAGIAQNSDYQNQIISEAERLGVKDRVHLTGPVSEAEKYWLMQHCLLFCFPSVAEGFGLPVIEAMHFGKQVVLSTCTSLPEIGGPDAYYFDGFSPEQVSQLTTKILQDVAANDNGEKMRKWSAQFTWEKTAKQYWDTYLKLLE